MNKYSVSDSMIKQQIMRQKEKPSVLVNSAEATVIAVSVASRFLLLLTRNIIVSGILLSLVPIFFGSKPLDFEAWQLIAQSDSLHESAVKLGIMLTILHIIGRRGV
jgi:hypothetical protein